MGTEYEAVLICGSCYDSDVYMYGV